MINLNGNLMRMDFTGGKTLGTSGEWTSMTMLTLMMKES